ncbi:hypothetical protein BKA66DRAFT_548581 [Pyrenochaeta sp. MPI-SDFR-AT-0127]|nr:hypothetical protein BKA66DRAFT_548581 [Pyrenochaeta sp. MPI-SDFR-AT-0127]
MFNLIDPGPEPSFEEDSQDGDVEMTIEDERQEAPQDSAVVHDPVNNFSEDRIIVAVDFGTTFSSVAYALLPRGVLPDDIDIRNVKCIGNYPGYEPAPGVLDFRYDVPTELWYDYAQMERAKQIRASTDDQNSDSDTEASSSSDDDVATNERTQPHDDDGFEDNTNMKPLKTKLTRTTQYWGYGVQQKLNRTNIPKDEARPLTRFKLNLDQKSETDEVRTDVKSILKTLIKERVIRNDTDIYAHYLTHLLKHTKEQLILSNDFHPHMLIQLVLCVPAKWPVRACRIMQAALEVAVVEADLGGPNNDSLHNIFMISEPEAAAECILAEASSELFHNESVVVVDAGGGTVDAVTYKCEIGDPLRLSEEVVAPDSQLRGASYINERFAKKLLHKLRKEKYLIKNGKTLKSIVQAKTTVFENYEKRIYDINREDAPYVSIEIDDLRESSKKRFFQNRVEFKRKTMKKFFEYSLQGVRSVLESQLDLAESQGCQVQKVILTGGFGQSPSLQSSLRTYLERRKNIRDWEIDLIVPNNPSTAVARGAVLRALNKRFGPTRNTHCSYGFLMSEEYDPDSIEAHQSTRCRVNGVDGLKYVDNTIRWVIQVGEKVESMQEFYYIVHHVFPITRKYLVCAEQLWMSDGNHKSHYRKTHTVNKGAEQVGTIEADFTFLKDKGFIQPQIPTEYSAFSGSQKAYWLVRYEVALVVEGRSIRFEARWPLREDLGPGQQQQVRAMKHVGIAAAFRPGTA